MARPAKRDSGHGAWLAPLGLLTLLAAQPGRAVAAEATPLYPETRRQAIVEELHGQRVADPFRWLEDDRAPEVRAWTAAQNGLTRTYLDAIPRRATLEARLTELFDVPWIGSPWIQNGRHFYHAQPKGVQKDILYWRDEADGIERVLIDPNQLGAPGENIALGRWSVTRDARTIAYTLRANNADESVIEIMDVESGRRYIADRLTGIKHSRMEWTLAGDGFYYTHLPLDLAVPESERPGRAEIRFHQMGRPQSEDRLVFPRTDDPKTFLRPRVSWDGRWLFVYIWRGSTGVTVYLRDLLSDDPTFQVFYDSNDSQIWVFDHGGYFYVHDNQNAPNKTLMRVKAGVFDRSAWEVVIPEDPKAVLTGVYRSRSRLLAVYLEDVQHRLQIHDLDGALLRQVALPAPGSVRGLKSHPERDDAYFTFSSHTIPWQTYRLSLLDGTTALHSETAVPVDPKRFGVDQVWVESRDGTKVPMFVIRDQTKPLDGSMPFLLTGYGGFSSSVYPRFWPALYPWLEAGGGVAIANLRGGGEFGETWHRAGMGHNKQNVFDDFIAAAEFLVAEGYTRSEHLAIRGRSNGGLLVGAAMTQRPDLFGAVICGVPLTDMLRFTALGVGKTWIEEYGDPAVKDDFEVLSRYSPYHRVVEGTDYPTTLITTADSDDRVHPGHARKFAAMLQAANPKGKPALLSIQNQAGHGGSGNTDGQVRAWADELLFLMDSFGMR